MYNIETVESLHAYANRLHTEAARAGRPAHRAGGVRQLLRKVRRTA
jgi:hypothetical protein